MNMVFTGDTLYVNLKGDGEYIDINYIKNKIFSVLEQYNVHNIIINTNGIYNSNRFKMSTIKKDYDKVYHGSLKIR